VWFFLIILSFLLPQNHFVGEVDLEEVFEDFLHQFKILAVKRLFGIRLENAETFWELTQLAIGEFSCFFGFCVWSIWVV
jgi:hypothetical protein